MTDGLPPIAEIAGAHKIGGLDPLKRASRELEGLAMGGARVRTRGGGPSLPSIFELQPIGPSQPAPAADTERSYGAEFIQSLLHTLGPQNIQLFGSGIQHVGQAMQIETLHDAGRRVKEWGRGIKLGAPATMPPVTDIDSALRWAAGGLGQGLGSITVPIAGGMAGAGMGAPAGPKGMVAGGVAGAFSADYFVLVGEAADQFRQEGVDKATAANAAVKIAFPMAALDTMGLWKLLQGPMRKPRQALLSYVARRMLHGATVESVTEMLQGVIREFTAADLTGKKDIARRVSHILEEGVIAGMTGGVVGAGASVVQRNRRAAQKPVESAPEPAESGPEPVESAPEPGPDGVATGTVAPEDQREFGDLPAEDPETDSERQAAIDEVKAQQAANAAALAKAQAEADALKAEADAAVKAVRPEVERRRAEAVEAQKTPDRETQEDLPVTDEPQEAPETTAGPEDAAPGVAGDDADAIQAEANTAATSPTNDLPEPTDAQKEAGNYKKGHVSVQGFDVTIENPKGSERTGTAPDGTKWSVRMPAHYGYIRRTEGADNDQVDVYVGDKPESPNVFVVDQVDAETKEFDEHKVFLGFETQAEVEAAYDAAFDDGRGPERRRAITDPSRSTFKAWLKQGDTTKPYSSEFHQLYKHRHPPEGFKGSPSQWYEDRAREIDREAAGQTGAIADALKTAAANVRKEAAEARRLESAEPEKPAAPATKPAVESEVKIPERPKPATEPGPEPEREEAARSDKEAAEAAEEGISLAVEKAREDIATGTIPPFGRDSVDRERAILQRFGDDAAKAYRAEFDRLSNEALKKRQEAKKAEEGAAAPEPAPSEPDSTPAAQTGPETAPETPASEPPPPPERPKDYGANNKIVTTEQAEELRARLRAKLRSQLGSGIDPEIFRDGTLLAVYHIEAGTRAFADFSKTMIEDLGEAARPFLRSWYEGARYYPGLDAEGMTPAVEIEEETAGDPESGTEVDAPAAPAGHEPRTPGQAVQGGDTGGHAGDPGGRRPGGDEDGPGGRDAEERPDGGLDGAGTRDSGPAGLSGERPGSERPRPDVPGGGRDDASNLRLANATDPVKEGRSPLQKARDNLTAIETLARIEAERRPATPEEQAALSLYSGWGGIKGAFLDVVTGRFAKGFETVGEQLRHMLTKEEYERAERSIQYAHYTSETVIRHMWALAERLGVKGGRIIEPGMGIGHFAGFMPDSIADAAETDYYGIEMDDISARIAKQLYPEYTIVHSDYAARPVRQDYFDFAIGNPPFANIPITNDRAYGKHKFLLHDFFFAKTLDSLKPGGILMFVTSAGTMNKKDTKAREYLAERADLVGAIRLPGGRQGAFAQNANTEVTTDIVVLRKRHPDEAPGDRSWVETQVVEYAARVKPNRNSPDKIGVTVNKYFRRNKRHILGEEGLHDTLRPNRYGVISEGGDLAARLQGTLRGFPKDIHNPIEVADQSAKVEELDAPEKEGSYYINAEGDLYQVRGGFGVEVKPRGKQKPGEASLSKADMALAKQLVGLRNALRDVMRANVARDEKVGNAARRELNRLHDALVKERGWLNTVKISEKKPTVEQIETEREKARESARLQGLPWDDGSYQPGLAFYDKKMKERARLRQAARDEAAREGRPFSEGSFDPKSVPPVETRAYPNLDVFKNDPEYFRLAAIELVDEDTGEISRGPVFTENVVTAQPEPEIRTAKDALFAVMVEKGRFDLDEVAAKWGRSVEETVAALGDDIYELPGRPGKFVASDEYLSGDVKTKLRIAKEKAADDSRFQRNVEALEKVIPEDLVPAEIAFSIGAKWIPNRVFVDFAKHLGLETPRFSYSEINGKFRLNAFSPRAANTKWGSDDFEAHQLLEKAVNLEPSPTVYVWDSSSNKKVKDDVATDQTRAKYRDIVNEWPSWLEGQDEAKAEAAAIFNEKFRRTAIRQYSGEHIVTPGVRKGMVWREYQKRVIARIIQAGNTYMAHAVGAGKTSAMIAAAMEMKRLGMITKPMFAVPPAMLRQFAVEFMQLYPNANILVADETRFHTDKRRQFIADVGLDNTLDAVIITHPAFRKIPLSVAFREQIIAEQIADLRTALADAKDAGAGYYVRSRIQQMIERLERSLDQQRDQDEVFTFEELGVDQLFIDEAQFFRKLGLATSQTVKGIDPDPSGRSLDLYEKVRYMRSLHPGRGVVFASGTPIVNTMGEAFNISRYLQEDTLRELGLHRFDNWAATFGQTKQSFEPNAAGRYSFVDRFSNFVNRPEIQDIVLQILDHVSPTDLAQNVALPRLKGGKRQKDVGPMSAEQRRYTRHLDRRIQAIKNRTGRPEPGDDIMLTVIGDGRKMSVDMRLIDPDAPNDPNSKLNRMIRKIHKTWEETKNQPFHKPDNETRTYSEKPVMHGPATQIAFVSLGLKGRFSIITWIKSELERMGVPREQVAFINDYNTSTKRQRLFNDMNEGKVRVLMGHPETLGTGVNVQSRLKAIHNLDPLWFPAFDEQRVGRILRQGNMNPEIEITDYAVETPLDTKMWSLMAKKAGFIHDFWTRDGVRTMADISMDDYYEEMMAATSGDPRVQELGELRRTVADLEQKEISHEREIRGLRLNKIAMRDDLKNAKSHLARMKRMDAVAENIGGDEFKAVFEWEGRERVEIATRAEAADLFRAAFKTIDDLRADTRTGETTRLAIGSVAGFDMVGSSGLADYSTRQVDRIELAHKDDPDLGFRIEVDSGKNPLPSIESKLRNIPQWVTAAEERLAKLERESADLDKLSSAPAFPHRQELKAAREQARQIENAMAEETRRQEAADRAAAAQAAATATTPTPTRDVGPEAPPARSVLETARWRQRASAEIARIARGWDPDTMPEIRIVRGAEDLPADLAEAFEADGTLRGAYWRNPTDDRAVVFIVPDNIANLDQLRRTLMHETVGHFSMQDMLGDEFPAVLAQVWKARDQARIKPVADEVAQSYADSSESVQAQEIVARLAERKISHPALVRAIAAVRRFLRSLGFRLSFTYDDIMGMIARAERRLRTGRDTRREAEFRRPEPDPPTDTQQLRQQGALDRLKDSMAEAVDNAGIRLDRGDPAADRRPARRRYIEAARPLESLLRVLTIPAGGLDENGDLRVTKKMQETVGKLVRETRPSQDGYFRWLDKPLETARHGWLNRYGTPREFIVRERQKFADSMEIMQELVGYLEGLSAEGVGLEEARALQEVLEGKELNDDRMKRMAGPIRKSIEGYGRELVEMGQLGEEAYLRNLGSYLHRSYRKYEFEAPGLVKWARARKRRHRTAALKGDELMARGRRHSVAMRRLLKDIPEQHHRLARSGQVTAWHIFDRVNDSGRVLRRVYWPAGPAGELIGKPPTRRGTWIDQGEWRLAHPKGKRPTGMAYLRRDWTEAEREAMGEIRDARFNLIKTYELLAHDIANGRFFEDIAANDDWYRAERPDGVVVDGPEVLRSYSTIAGIEWVRVPDTDIPKSGAKRWGAIAGGYVRAAIWRDMNELEKMQTPGTWGWLLREWKANKTARSPTVHFNNTIGNLILSELYDFTPGDLIRGLREFAAKGEVYQEAVREGIFGSGFVRVELNRADIDGIIEKVVREVEGAEGIEHGNARQVFELFKRLDRGMRNIYRWEDEIFRLVSYTRDRHRGLDAAEAAQNAIDRFLNYDIRAPWPNALRRSVLPFLSYTYAFVPQWLKAMSNKPWKIAKIFALGYVLQELAYEVTDGDEDEERRAMAERDMGLTWAGLPKLLRLPLTDESGTPLYLGMTRMLPGGGFLDTDKGQIALPEWMMVSGPIATAAEVWINRSAYSGDDIVNRMVDTEMEAAEKRMVYLWRSMMPNATWIPGSWNWKMLTGSLAGETDIFGRAYDPVIAGIRQVGPRLYPFDLDAQRAYRAMEITREMQEYRRKARELAMDRNQNRIGQRAYDRGISRVQDGLARLQERAARIMGHDE